MQHCYNGDVSFLWEKLELWSSVRIKPLNRLYQTLSQLITSWVDTTRQIWQKSTHGDFWANRWNVWATYRDQTPLWILCLMAQNARNHAIMQHFCVWIFNSNIWPYLPQHVKFGPKLGISSQIAET